MAKDTKIKHFKKVQSMKIDNGVVLKNSGCSVVNSDINISTSSCNSKRKLSFSFDTLSSTDISPTTLEGIWLKAEMLLSNNHVMLVSWSENNKDRLVGSSSSDSPHVVKVKKNSCLYICDSKCPMFAGFSICSHVVASVEDNNDLFQCLSEFILTRTSPDLTAIAIQGLPSGARRKGGRTKRKRNKTITPIESFTNRIFLNNPRSKQTRTDTLPSDNVNTIQPKHQSPPPSTLSNIPSLIAAQQPQISQHQFSLPSSFGLPISLDPLNQHVQQSSSFYTSPSASFPIMSSSTPTTPLVCSSSLICQGGQMVLSSGTNLNIVPPTSIFTGPNNGSESNNYSPIRFEAKE